jgi:hypothetical protein
VEKSLRQRILTQLAAIAIGAGAGAFEPTASLLGIPEDDLIDLVGDTAEEPLGRRQYLALLTMDARDPVRERVADAARALAERAPAEAEPIIRTLSADISPRVRAAASRGLMALIDASPPFDRVALVSRWALSSHASERLAIARALQTRTPVFVADLALEGLAEDPDPRVRTDAARAMAHRIHEAPDAYARKLTALSVDSDPRVGRTADRLLRVLSGVRALA